MEPSLASKHQQWVLDTIDCLRQRKARPDWERISKMVARLHGLTHAETKESLDALIAERIVNKVDYKGQTSYRHNIRRLIPANPSPETNNVEVKRVYQTSARIQQALKAIIKETGDGVSFSDLENWLLSKNPETRLVKHRLETALKKEIMLCNVSKLSDNTYVITDQLPKPKGALIEHKKTFKSVKREKETPLDIPNKLGEKDQNISEEVKNDQKDDVKRERPLSKRKKFKKTHGPDFDHTFGLKRSSSRDDAVKADVTDEPRCVLCLTGAAIYKETEQLLTCKHCGHTAHPSCMNYSPVLARHALAAPWQCMDCKTCTICNGEENADLLLVCDECDQGYHMTCHTPPVANKPKGKWICQDCKRKRKKESQSVEGPRKRKGSVKPMKAPEVYEYDCERTKVDVDVLEESGEEEDPIPRPGKRRKLSHPSSLALTYDPYIDVTSPYNDEPFSDFTDGTVGASCLPTPSASPCRPGDTFDYEMKMSLNGISYPIEDDTISYSDATDWNIDDVVNFFEEIGFKDNAQVFKDQEIDGRSLLLMKRNDVLTGLGLKLGPALKLYKKIVRLQLHSQAVTVV